MLRRNVVRCCVVVVRSEPPPTVGQGGRSPGGRPGPGKIWEVEVEGGDTAASTLTLITLHGKVGTPLTLIIGPGKSPGQELEAGRGEGFEDFVRVYTGARTIHLLDRGFLRNKLDFKLGHWWGDLRLSLGWDGLGL